MLWFLIGFLRSLKSSHKEAVKMPLLFEGYSDLTSPTSNHIDIAVSVEYDTLKIFFKQLCMFILFNLSFSL